MATRMPPRAVPSSLVITRPVTPAALAKISTCDRAFWPTVASSTSSTACGAVGSTFLMTRTIFSSSPISSALVLQAPGRVDQQHVGAFGARWRERVEGEARGVRALRARHHLGADALAPHLELLDRRGAEGVARRQHHLVTLRAQLGAELADGGGLAGAVDPDHQHHKRLLRRVDGERAGHGGQQALHLLGEDRRHRRRIEAASIASRADRLGDARRRVDAEIGAQQRVLEILQGLSVEPALGEQVGDARRQPGRGARQTLAQTRPPRWPLGFRRSGGFGGGRRGGNGDFGERRGLGRGGRLAFFNGAAAAASPARSGAMVSSARPIRRCQSDDFGGRVSFVIAFRYPGAHDIGRARTPHPLPRRPDAGDRQAGRRAGACRAAQRARAPRRWPAAAGGGVRRAEVRPAAPARARPPARPRHLGLPGARPQPGRARKARAPIQGGQGRQALLGRGRRLAADRGGRRRPAATAAAIPSAAGG